MSAPVLSVDELRQENELLRHEDKYLAEQDVLHLFSFPVQFSV